MRILVTLSFRGGSFTLQSGRQTWNRRIEQSMENASLSDEQNRSEQQTLAKKQLTVAESFC